MTMKIERRMIGLAALAALTAFAVPTASASEEPAGRSATYRISIQGTWTTTGVAVARSGTVLTTSAILARCPEDAPCRIWVEAPEDGRDVWHRATVAGSDEATGIVALRVDASLPAAARLRPGRARLGEPVHGYAYDGNDVRFLVGNVREVADVHYPSRPEGETSPAVLSTMDCPAGSPGAGVFAIVDEALVGIVFGPVDADDRPGLSAAVPSTAIRAFLDRNRIPYDPPARRSRPRR
jgi:hypothetical protein